jgi:hypothetical protein
LKRRFKANLDSLPEPLYLALTRDKYVQIGKYSISGLIGPPQPRVLLERHGHNIVYDPYDRLKSLVGVAVHDAIEQHVDTGTHIAERRFVATINGIEVSGQPDVFSVGDGVLYDYKTTSTWVSDAGIKNEWAEQLNPYVWLMNQSGLDVKRAVIVAIYMDWSKTKLRFKKMRRESYPTKPVELFEIPVWEDFVTEAFIAERIRVHEEANALPDAELPECTAKERWQRITYAVQKPGATRASKLCDSRQAADAEAERLGPDYEIEERVGEPTRCLHYCDAAPFCHQHKRDLRKE